MIPGHLELEYVALLDLYRKRVRHRGSELPLYTLVLDGDGLCTYRARERSTSEKAQQQHCCIARHPHDILLQLVLIGDRYPSRWFPRGLHRAPTGPRVRTLASTLRSEP